MKRERAQGPPPLPGPRARRLRRRGRRRAHALRALRGEARAGERQPAPRRRRAGEGLAHRPRAAPARGAARRRRPRVVAHRLRHRRRDRARRRRLRHRLGRQLRARRRARARARTRRSTPRAIAEEALRIAADDLHLHQRPARRRGARTPRPSADGRPSRPREIVSELDRYIVGQRAAKRAVAIALRNRWRRQHVPEPSCATRSRRRTSS